jgi:hypothetical protein
VRINRNYNIPLMRVRIPKINQENMSTSSFFLAALILKHPMCLNVAGNFVVSTFVAWVGIVSIILFSSFLFGHAACSTNGSSFV